MAKSASFALHTKSFDSFVFCLPFAFSGKMNGLLMVPPDKAQLPNPRLKKHLTPFGGETFMFAIKEESGISWF